MNDVEFASSGGDPNDVAGTVDAGYADARARSYAPQFYAVGWIGNCTATWVGDSPDGLWSYILTAAHCGDDSATQTSFSNRSFRDYAGNIVAQGAGTFFVPEERVNRPAGFGGASTDIALMRLPRTGTILDPGGAPIAPAVIYDGRDEPDRLVTLVGRGSWGTGTTGSDGSLQPSTGVRRASGTNVIERIFENDHGIGFNFDDPAVAGSGATQYEAALASGDSGSAWWQQHDGVWSVIATTNGGSGTTYGRFSTGARASMWSDWLQDTYPQITLHSQVVPEPGISAAVLLLLPLARRRRR